MSLPVVLAAVWTCAADAIAATGVGSLASHAMDGWSRRPAAVVRTPVAAIEVSSQRAAAVTTTRVVAVNASAPRAAAVVTTPISGSLTAVDDTLIAPFNVGMSIAEIDTLASTLRMRWLGREIRYAGDSALSLFELRDTTARGVLIYSLTLHRGRLRQVELHRNVTAQDAPAFSAWVGGVIRALAASSESSSFEARVTTFCREATNGASITTRLLLRDGDHATIVACSGTFCPALQRP